MTRADRPDDAGGGETDAPEGSPCDYCRLPIPGDAVVEDHDGIAYTFCSEACCRALKANDSVFTAFHGFRTVRPGPSAMNRGLPQGMRRNSFVLLSGQSGTRDEAVQAELVWRTLERGEPVVVVSFLDTPTSIIQGLVGFEWNVIPAIESGRLRILDCFTHRLASDPGERERSDPFTDHLRAVAREAAVVIEDPTNLRNVRSQLVDCLDGLGMEDRGAVVIDSLTELGSLVQPVKAYDFVKGVRAQVSKGRFVPVFAGATRTGDPEEFPHTLEYMVDGIVDLGFTDEAVPDTLLKRLRIRKMAGVLTIPEWHIYEYTAGDGQVVFDPEAEMQKSEQRRLDEM